MWFSRRRVTLSDLNTGLTGVERLIRQADTARDHGDLEGAAAIYRQVLDRSPDRNDVKVQLGNMLKDAGHLRDAASVYREAQAADPDNADICVQMGHVLKLMGNRTAAFEQYHRAVALNPHSSAATQELAEAGYSWQQRQRFEVNLRAKGAEALMLMSRQIAAMRKTLDTISAMLPDTLAQTAFPIDLYDSYRELYAVPPPPGGRRVSMTILLLADREAPPVLYRQLAAVRAQTNGAWTLRVVGRDPARAAIVALAATRRSAHRLGARRGGSGRRRMGGRPCRTRRLAAAARAGRHPPAAGARLVRDRAPPCARARLRGRRGPHRLRARPDPA